MESRSISAQTIAPRSSSAREIPSVTPVFPLLLLETMRDLDHPGEVLEDEDFTLSMPRRLGLSDVVRVQIQRFEGEVKHRRLQEPSLIEDLLRLVIRRPDCEEICVETGRRIAERSWDERSAAFRRVVRILPRPLALLFAQRAGRRLLAPLVGRARFQLQRSPLMLRIEGTLTSRADEGGAACAIYTGALTALLEQYTPRKYRVLHARCGRGEPGQACEWSVEIAA